MEVIVNKTWCKGCGLCVSFCPKHLLTLQDGVAVMTDIDKCSGCYNCEIYCPDFAIQVKKESKTDLAVLKESVHNKKEKEGLYILFAMMTALRQQNLLRDKYFFN